MTNPQKSQNRLAFSQYFFFSVVVVLISVDVDLVSRNIYILRILGGNRFIIVGDNLCGTINMLISLLANTPPSIPIVRQEVTNSFTFCTQSNNRIRNSFCIRSNISDDGVIMEIDIQAPYNSPRCDHSDTDTDKIHLRSIKAEQL